MGKPGKVAVDSLGVQVFQIPTEQPESDGTLQWDHTTAVVMSLRAAGSAGLGYTYNHAAAASVIERCLAPLVRGSDAMAVGETWRRMRREVRNIGDHGIAAAAISGVDSALWDLKARLLGVSLVDLLGPVHTSVPLYASGGFISESMDELCTELGGWVEQGLSRVKMKVGRDLRADPERVRAGRDAIGPAAELFFDANGGYTFDGVPRRNGGVLIPDRDALGNGLSLRSKEARRYEL